MDGLAGERVDGFHVHFCSAAGEGGEIEREELVGLAVDELGVEVALAPDQLYPSAEVRVGRKVGEGGTGALHVRGDVVQRMHRAGGDPTDPAEADVVIDQLHNRGRGVGVAHPTALDDQSYVARVNHARTVTRVR